MFWNSAAKPTWRDEAERIRLGRVEAGLRRITAAGRCAGCVLAVILTLSHATSVQADDFRRKTKFWAQLNAPMTAVVDGMSFRRAIERVSEPVGINVCLDRRVDPTSPINPGTLGPTIFVALNQMAKTRDCVVMPVCNVVLVGRPEWVDATATSLLTVTQSTNDTANVDVHWPDLTTGRKALAVAIGKESADVKDVGLPHDLWPAQTWSQIDRRVAVSLVLSQFDLRLAAPVDVSTERLVATTADGRASVERSYSSDTRSSLVRRVVKSNDSASRSIVDDDVLLIKATAKAHRLGTDALLTEFAKSVAAKADKDSQTYTVRRTTTSAGAALVQFAKASGRRCIIEPAAMEACRQQIRLEAEDESLKSLINRIAIQADVLVQWHDDKIVVTTK